ncbi:MAG: esterase-like activity of phytase family protein [Pseudomonadota bacterium]
MKRADQKPSPWCTAAQIASLATLALVGSGLAAQAACPANAPGLAVTAEPVTLSPERLDGVSIAGAWVLTAPDPRFGGFSGLLVEPGAEGLAVTAVTDRGALMTALYDPIETGCPLSAVSLETLTEEGSALTGDARDAEALARYGDALLIAFERDHRIAVARGTALEVGAWRDPEFEALPFNGGIEALAATPEGIEPADTVIAIGEEADSAGFPFFVLRDRIDGAERPREARLRLPPPHSVTGADIGSDGRLYLVRRHFDPSVGVSILVEAFRRSPVSGATGADAGSSLPIAADARQLALFGPRSGIDNMEAIAAWVDADGAVHLTLISDDNFNPLQRTLLLDLVLEE